MSQQFCLKWNNHMPNMIDVFKNLLTTESMVDVTLACDGLSLKAHKIVLSACSSFFQSLFLENPCKHPIVILKDMKYNELKAIIEFMYHGEVNVAQDQLSALMKTAEALKVKGLAETTGDKGSLNVQDDSNCKSSEVDASLSKRKRYRMRKRRRSESDRSDEEVEPTAKQPSSPEIEELSDTSVDISGKCLNLQSRVPQVEKSVCVEGNFVSEMKFTEENCKLLEQSLTDDLLRHKSSQSPVSLSIEAQKLSKIADSSVLVSTSSQLVTSDQQPESPPDIKPTILELSTAMAHVAGSSHNLCDSSVLNMEHSNLSHPGTSGHDSSQGVSQSSSVTDANDSTKESIGNIHLGVAGELQKQVSLANYNLGRPSHSDTLCQLKTINWGHFPEHIPSTACKQHPSRRCLVCSKRRVRSETTWQCKQCRVPLHLPLCFERYHTLQNY